MMIWAKRFAWLPVKLSFGPNKGKRLWLRTYYCREFMGLRFKDYSDFEPEVIQVGRSWVTIENEENRAEVMEILSAMNRKTYNPNSQELH